MQQTQQRRRLTEFESTMAFVVGGGLTLLVIAFALAAMRGAEANFSLLNIMVLLGIGLLILGTVAWLFVSRPWQNYDDWSVPLYTGEHEHHAEPHAEEHHEEPNAMQAHTVTAPVTTPVEANPVPAVHVEQVDPHPVVTEFVAEPTPPAPPVVAVAEPLVAESVPVEPAAVDATAEDELTKLEGIGPKIAGALKAAGVRTFAAVAAKQPAELEQIVRGAGVRMVGHGESWPKQAALAAEGKWEELEQLQSELKAGNESAADA